MEVFLLPIFRMGRLRRAWGIFLSFLTPFSSHPERVNSKHRTSLPAFRRAHLHYCPYWMSTRGKSTVFFPLYLFLCKSRCSITLYIIHKLQHLHLLYMLLSLFFRSAISNFACLSMSLKVTAPCSAWCFLHDVVKLERVEILRITAPLTGAWRRGTFSKRSTL